MYILKHFLTICRHKYEVFKQCAACGLVWQGITHDLSKFSPTEFIPSAKFFQGSRSPLEAQKEVIGYSAAWLHHKGCNPHHWEYWTDFNQNGEIITVEIPRKYVVEMICDWIGAGKVYSKEKWTTASPLDYYNKVRSGRHFNPITEATIMSLLTCIKYSGLKMFHKLARDIIKEE